MAATRSAAVGPAAVIGRYGLRIPRDALIKKVGDTAYRKILKVLTVVEKVHAGKPRGMARIVRRGFYFARFPPPDNSAGTPIDHVIVPRIRGSAFLKANAISQVLVDENDSYPEPRQLSDESREFSPPDPLYEYQEAAVRYLCGGEDAMFSQVRADAHSSTVYLKMGAGLGKTRTAAAVICKLAVPTLVVVPTEGIAEQWMDEFAESCPGLRCVLYRNPSKKSKKIPPNSDSHDVLVVIVNTFREKTPDFISGFGLVVLDEAHELHSPKNSKTLWLAQTKYVLALSATPLEKKDGLDALVPVHMGPIVAESDIPGFDAGDAAFTGEVWRIEYTGHPDHCETATTPSGTVSAIMTIANVNKDPCRQRLIADNVVRLYNMHKTPAASRYGLGRSDDDPADAPERRHGIFVFAEHREQLPALRQVLLERLSDADIIVPELEQASASKKERKSEPKAPETNLPCRSLGQRQALCRSQISIPTIKKHPKWPGGEKWGDLVTPRGKSWWFSAADVEKDTSSLYLFGENDAEKVTVPARRVGLTQAVIRGLPNSVGIRTCYARGRGYRDETYDENVQNMSADFAEALEKYRSDPSLKWVVFPGDGIGTGKARLNTDPGAARTFAALLKLQADFVRSVRGVGSKKQSASVGPDRSISLLRGGVAKDELGKTRRAKSHIVLTTYGYSRRGISLPDMTALVMASPRRNGGKQLLGRIKRRGSDQRIRRVVVDIVDVCTGLKSQSTDRNRSYKNEGFPVYTTRTSHDRIRMPETKEKVVTALDSISDSDMDAIIEGLMASDELGEDRSACDIGDGSASSPDVGALDDMYPAT